MRAALVIILCLSGIAAGAQSNSSAAATAHIGKGYELVQDERFAEAAEEFRAALTLDPDAVNARYQLAICLFAMGEHDASRKEFERVCVVTRHDPKVEYYLARIDLLGGNPAAAIRRLVPLMAKPPFPTRLSIWAPPIWPRTILRMPSTGFTKPPNPILTISAAITGWRELSSKKDCTRKPNRSMRSRLKCANTIMRPPGSQ